MRLLSRFPFRTAAALLVVACSEGPVSPDVGDPLFEILDGAHGSGIDHFFFLPPMVPAPTPGGMFDASRLPTVEICLVNEDATGCADVQPMDFPITFGDEGTGGLVRVVPEDEHYIANWDTDQFTLLPDATYRINVLEPGPLGHADVQVAAKGSELRNMGTGDFVPLLNGRTLPIKFRIEEGSPFVVDVDGGEISAAGGDVVLVMPAVEGEVPVPITVEAVPPGDVVGGVAGTVFEIEAPDVAFTEEDAEIKLTFTYDLGALTQANPDARPEDLALFTLVDGIWVPLGDPHDGVRVDLDEKTVSGLTDHFSLFGINTLTRVCSDEPGEPGDYDSVQEAYDKTVPGGMIEICAGTHVVEDVQVDAPVTIRGVGGTVEIQNETAISSFKVSSGASGTVAFRGLTFVNASPFGSGVFPYSIRIEAEFDQVVIDGSSFTNTAGWGGLRVDGAGSGPDAHVLVQNSSFTGGVGGVNAIAVSGRIEGNEFTNCFFSCVRVSSGSDVDVIDNHFADATTGVNPFFHSVILFSRSGTTGTVERNVIDGCGMGQCIDVSNGPTVDVINNDITVYHGHGTAWGIVGFSDDQNRVTTLVIKDNTIEGVGGNAETDPTEGDEYAIEGAGILLSNASGTVFGNSVTNANRGLYAINGGVITDGTGTDGGDNVVDLVFTGVASEGGSTVTIDSSDFTRYQISIDGDFDPGSLTCNWWGDIFGPHDVGAGVDGDVYTPWLNGVASDLGTTCTGGP